MKSLIFDSFSEATATYSEETIASFRVLNVNCSVSESLMKMYGFYLILSSIFSMPMYNFYLSFSCHIYQLEMIHLDNSISFSK